MTTRAILVFCTAALIAPAAQSDTSITWLGEFTNARFTAEHAYGHAIRLWREGDRVFGLFYAMNGLAGDTPVGLLQDVRFDAASGDLAFRAKLSVAATYLERGGLEPTADWFSFEGTWTGDAIVGTLTHADARRPGHEPATERVRLVRSDDPPLIDAANYDDWRREVEPILQRRGPKW